MFSAPPVLTFAFSSGTWVFIRVLALRLLNNCGIFKCFCWGNSWCNHCQTWLWPSRSYTGSARSWTIRNSHWNQFIIFPVYGSSCGHRAVQSVLSTGKILERMVSDLSSSVQESPDYLKSCFGKRRYIRLWPVQNFILTGKLLQLVVPGSGGEWSLHPEMFQGLYDRSRMLNLDPQVQQETSPLATKWPSQIWYATW